MTKHKIEYYKFSEVKYYLNNKKGDGYKKTCKIFDYKKSTLRHNIFSGKTSPTRLEIPSVIVSIKQISIK